MRKFTVKWFVDDADMVKGEKPHSEIYETEEVEAESSMEAIDLVIDFLIDQGIQNNTLSPERDGDRINFMDPGGEIAMRYYNFSVDSPIKVARTEAGFSRAEMSRRFEIPIRTLENWETGTRSSPVWAEKLIVEKLERQERIDTLHEILALLDNCEHLEEAKEKIKGMLGNHE